MESFGIGDDVAPSLDIDIGLCATSISDEVDEEAERSLRSKEAIGLVLPDPFRVTAPSESIENSERA